MSLKEKLDPAKLPRHIAIIMDGNGRWAKKKGRLRVFGHEQGAKAVRTTVEAAARLGIEYLTLYAFSTENWHRPKYEVDALMHLLIHSLNKEVKSLHKNNIKLIAIGNLDALPGEAASELRKAIDTTSENTGLKLILALSYSSKWELTEAFKSILQKVISGELQADAIDENTIQDHLCTAKLPDPELLIRTSGEMRISNFLLWQIAYSELYFTSTLWPDFTEEQFYQAILDYQNRERRFGLTSEQIKTGNTP